MVVGVDEGEETAEVVGFPTLDWVGAVDAGGGTDGSLAPEADKEVEDERGEREVPDDACPTDELEDAPPWDDAEVDMDEGQRRKREEEK